MSEASASCPDGSHLTAREHEILQLLAQGFTNVQIAEHCWISRHTVNIHVCRILAKLGAVNRTRAVSLAHHHGLILSQ